MLDDWTREGGHEGGVHLTKLVKDYKMHMAA